MSRCRIIMCKRKKIDIPVPSVQLRGLHVPSVYFDDWEPAPLSYHHPTYGNGIYAGVGNCLFKPATADSHQRQYVVQSICRKLPPALLLFALLHQPRKASTRCPRRRPPTSPAFVCYL